MPRINMHGGGMPNVQRVKRRDDEDQQQQQTGQPAFARPAPAPPSQNNDPGQFVSGGVDPKTQFVTTQNLQAKANNGDSNNWHGSHFGHGGGGCSGHWHQNSTPPSSGNSNNPAPFTGGGGSTNGNTDPSTSGTDPNSNPASFTGGGGSTSGNTDPSTSGTDPNSVTGTAGTTGAAAGDVPDAELNRIAGGDPDIVAALKLMLKDPEGAKLVKLMQQKHGTVVDDESLSGGAVGMSPVGGGDNPVVRLKKSAIHNIGDRAQFMFHEFTHVSGDPGDANHANGNDGQDSVYNAQKAFCERMGIPFAS